MPSVLPPAANGTMIVTGFCGHACAKAGVIRQAAARPAAEATKWRRVIIMILPVTAACAIDSTSGPVTFCYRRRGGFRTACSRGPAFVQVDAQKFQMGLVY